MACETVTDEHGTSYYIPDVEDAVTPGGKTLPGSPSIELWWSRLGEEKLLIRQENKNTVDIIEVTLGQLYDLIDGLNKAVETA